MNTPRPPSAPARPARRGTMLVAALVMITLLTVVVATVVLGGGRDADLVRLRFQNDRAKRAADAAAHMAVKELMDDVDRDSDGGIGTISNDGNAANDPIINSNTRLWATKSVIGSITTVTARAQADGAAYATQVVLNTPAGAPATAGTILFVVPNAAALGAQETARRTLMEGWGYTVVPITASSSQAAYDAAALTSSCAYVCETITSGDLGAKLVNAPIGIVSEEEALTDEFGFSTATTMFDNTAINVTNNTHYITSVFPTGSLTVWSSSQGAQGMWSPSGTLGGFTTLAQRVSGATPVLEIFERGDTRTPSGTAAGRRVSLPWGTGVNINALTASGRTIMQRAIEWCLLPVAHWKLDDAAGVVAVDSIAGRNGALSGATWTTGKISGAMSLNGATNYCSVPNHAAFQVTGALTIAGWINASIWPADSNFASPVLRKGDPNPNNWQLCVVEGRVKLILDDYDAYGISGGTLLLTNTWYHVAATWDGVNARVYVNGVLDNTPFPRAAPIGTDTQIVYIGGRSGATDITNGKVDDVRFYSRALTPAEIAALATPTGRPQITSWTAVAP